MAYVPLVTDVGTRMGDLTLITGGARGGKSAFAESLAAQSGRPVTYIATYIATLEPLDDEMRDRIDRHRARRSATWRTIEPGGEPGGDAGSEAGCDLVAAVAKAGDGDTVLIDCIAVWTSNRLLALGDDDPSTAAVATIEDALAHEVGRLLAAIAARSGPAIVVTNEVGDGVVPPYALGRAYRDLLGRVNQQLSCAAQQAYLVVAGRALPLPPPF